MKNKIILGFICFILILIPLIAVGSIIQNPFGFMGDLIFSTGDTLTNKEIKEMYKEYVNSDLGKEIENYIVSLEEKNNIFLEHNNIILPLMMSYTNKDFKNIKKMTIKEKEIQQRIDELYQLRVQNESIYEYLKVLKNNNTFSKMNNISDTTLISYFDDLTEKSKDSFLPIDVEREVYQKKENPFIPTYRGQCTWFAWARAKELTGKTMPIGNARDWLTMTNLPTGKEPKNKSVAVFSGTTKYPNNQHVLFVEDFSNGIITFSEGNYNNPCLNGTCDMVAYARKNYKKLVNVQSMPYNVFLIKKQFDLTLMGYIYTE